MCALAEAYKFPASTSLSICIRVYACVIMFTARLHFGYIQTRNPNVKIRLVTFIRACCHVSAIFAFSVS